LTQGLHRHRSELFVEPDGDEPAGTMKLELPASAYQRYTESQDIPIVYGGGIRDVREVELAPWHRFGVPGAFISLDGLTDFLGMHVIEIPPLGATRPARQCYEEHYWVVEGAGTAELANPDGSGHQRFEWRRNSLLAVPMNAEFRFVNTQGTSALLLAGNTAPPVINTFDDVDFVFQNPFSFKRRYDGSPAYFTPNLTLLAAEDAGRAMWRTNFIPDVADCELPLDNQRSPGYRRVEIKMAGGYVYGFIGEHGVGRYSKAHSHSSGAVLICVKGAGYTLNWPREVGTNPWASGHADRVQCIDYIQGGVVAAAPGGGSWYHQHFGSSAGPLRLLVLVGGAPGHQYHLLDASQSYINKDIEDGGASISYRSEDPYVRAEFEARLARNGVTSHMRPELYE
jgi:mannose-6-phosphate isomerase-like protein (cupin superfamily)